MFELTLEVHFDLVG